MVLDCILLRYNIPCICIDIAMRDVTFDEFFFFLRVNLIADWYMHALPWVLYILQGMFPHIPAHMVNI